MKNLFKFLTALTLGLMCMFSYANPHTSIYQIGGDWHTQDNKVIKLDELKGKYQIMAMIYTNCKYACPIIVKTIKDMEKALPENLKDQTHFLLVSLTPEEDTPPVMKKFFQKFGLGKNWTMLQGDKERVQALTMLLNIKVSKMADGQLAHSNTFTLLDKDGTVMYQLQGFQKGIQPMIHELKELSKKEQTKSAHAKAVAH